MGLGLGCTYHDTGEIHQISSPLDILSYTAFQQGVREAVYETDSKNQKVKFTHWLPLYICEEHGTKARPLIEASLKKLYGEQKSGYEYVITPHPSNQKKPLSIFLLPPTLRCFSCVDSLLKHEGTSELDPLFFPCLKTASKDSIHRLMCF